MKAPGIFGILALAFATPSLSIAQVTSDSSTSPTSKNAKLNYRHDVSLFTQSGGPLKHEGSTYVQGGAYRWASSLPQTFWKLGLGAGNSSYTTLQRRQSSLNTDTALDILYRHHDRILLATGGIETQRHLWRGLYLTAGLEVQAGGSSGHVDSITQVTYTGSGPGSVYVAGNAVRYANARDYFGTGLGVLGIRGYHGRFTAALEMFTGARAGIRSQTLTRELPDAARRYSSFDFSLGGFGTRLSVGYRF